MNRTTKHTVIIKGEAPESKMTLISSSTEHGEELRVRLETTFGAERLLVDEAGKKISLPIPVARISEFWALVNEVSRSCDFIVNFSD